MNRTRLQIGILALSTMTMAGIFITPIIGQIVAAFPDSSVSSVQLIISVNTLGGMAGTWLVSLLRRFMSHKAVALTAITGVLIFGLLPFFIHSSVALLIGMSGLLGIMLGFLTNTLPTLISENYNQQERQGVMGRQVAFSSIGAMLFIWLAGILGTIDWYYAYLVYIAAALVIVITAVTLPSGEKTRAPQAVTSEGDPARARYSLREALAPAMWVIIVFGFFMNAGVTAYQNNVSLVVTENQLGDSAYSGTISMLYQLGGLVAGFAIAGLVRVIKHHMYAMAFACEGVGLLIIGLLPNTIGLIGGSVIAGMGLSFYYAQAPFLVSVIEKPWLISLGIAAMATANNLGGFASPFIINWVNNLVLQGTAVGAMIVSAVILLVIAAILVVTNFQQRVLKSAYDHA